MSKKIISLAMFSFLALSLAGCGTGNSQNQNGKNAPQDKNNPGNPPAEMTSACDGKSEGDSCEVALPGKSEKTTGTCKKMSQGNQLSCFSQNAPGGPNGNGPKPDDNKNN